MRGGYKKFRNKELHDLYMSTKNIIQVIKSRKMRWPGNVMHAKSACKILMGKLEGRRPLEQTRPRWKENISMSLKEIGKASVNWTHLAQDTIMYKTV